jgi:formylglycine-generating enzyme required for sulfatase activity
MSTTADLELNVRRRGEGSYEIDLRFTQPDSDADMRLLAQPVTVTVDVKALRKYHLNDKDYGQALTEILFDAEAVKQAFKEARQIAQTLDTTLRVRLFIDPNAPELHSLRWETLRDPQFDSNLLTDEQVVFSRYLSSLDWRPVRLRAFSTLKALVVIANPTDLDPAQLAPIDVAGEQARAQAGLADVETNILASGGQATLVNMIHHLRDGCDILYLVCHGALESGIPHLWLENDKGETDVVSGETLVTHLRQLQHRPRLIVLASCQSAGTGEKARSNDNGDLAALGPLLAEVGIPAVLAMQGNITMQTIEQFMPEFFRELGKDGQIDRAMAVARSVVRERSDWWMPVLFMRLKSGMLWETEPEWERLPFEPEMVPVFGSPFLMGTQEADHLSPDEVPQTELDLDKFWIGKYPVTNQQYLEFIRQTNRVVGTALLWDGNLPPKDRLNFPVTGVTWYEAIDYCNWLSEQTGRAYTLPSEAQWEKAARGDNGTTYPWGNEWQPDRCNQATDFTAIDTFPAQSDYGCFDMVGNAREWTTTLWGSRPQAPDPEYSGVWQMDGRDNINVPKTVRRVYRGGRAKQNTDYRCSTRAAYLPDKPGPKRNRHGFRVVLIQP